MIGAVAASLSPAELGQVPISLIPVLRCRPSPENDRLYRPVDPLAPDVIELAASIAKQGVLEPIVITCDDWIVSGHRRREAARVAGVDVIPCRVLDVCRDDDVDAFVKLLREFNRQREKTHDERLRENVLDADPAEAHRALVEYRRRRADVDAQSFQIVGVKRRATISKAKLPFMAAIERALSDRRQFWPLSDRQIHYALLNDPPLRHAGKTASVYVNDVASYKSLVELLTRARIDGQIPMQAIADETRPVVLWDAHPETTGFMRGQIDGFLKGYSRDLMQSQPNHVELIGEKNTVASILRPVAGDYCIPMTTGRGYCSLPPRAQLVSRYRKSGKTKLVLLIVSDFDPDGEEIAHSFARSIRDDFGVSSIHPIKVALTAEQVWAYKLPPVMKAKLTSAHHGKFTGKYGDDVFELEALPPAELQRVVREAIDSVIDVDAFNREVDAERADAAHLDGVRRTVHEYLKGLQLVAGE